MTKKFYLPVFLLTSVVIAGLLSGCCHAEVFTEPCLEKRPAADADGMVPVGSGRAYNSGYYLFNVWPLYTGHPGNYNRKDYHSFQDDIQPSRNASMLLRELQKKYKAEKLSDIEHTESSWGYFSLWIVWRKTICTSATGMRSAAAIKKSKSSAKRKNKFL
ncbi:MAG: hypothetical protein E7052_09875 [Lentisphaerae bacterium]|nr:hypothetical protein [Lentisphaerota bacterium]